MTLIGASTSGHRLSRNFAALDQTGENLRRLLGSGLDWNVLSNLNSSPTYICHWQMVGCPRVAALSPHFPNFSPAQTDQQPTSLPLSFPLLDHHARNNDMEFKCDTCSVRFQRDDHLQRHQLSHSEPRFKCAHKQCGMRFHRRDAVKRHEKSHQQTNSKKRCRKPRRGILPCPRVEITRSARRSVQRVSNREGVSGDSTHSGRAVSSPSAGVDAGISGQLQGVCDSSAGRSPQEATNQRAWANAILSDCAGCATIKMLCDECIGHLVLPVMGLAEDQHGAFWFCLQHFVRVHAQGFPFLHSSSWRTDWVPSGKLLAMAAVGGRQIPSYVERSRVYFELAVNLVRGFTAASLGSEDRPADDGLGSAVGCDDDDDDGYHRRLLTSFETHILLIEHSLWSNHAELRDWGIGELANQAITILPTIAEFVRKRLHPNTTSWRRWILLEESKRALWCFYCLAVKSRHFLDSPIFASELVKSLHLPCPDSLFEAPDGQSWKMCTDEAYGSPNVQQQQPDNNSVLFQQAFYHLLAELPMPPPLTISTTNQAAAKSTSQILLCALIDTFQTSLTIPTNFNTFDAYLQTDIYRFRPRAELLRALEYWKSLFWRDPHELWHHPQPHHHDVAGWKYPPDYQITTMMLCVYLEVRMWEESPLAVAAHPLSAVHRRAAAQIAFDTLSAIARTGFLEVGTKSLFYVERIAYFCTRRLARAMLVWFDINIAGQQQQQVSNVNDDDNGRDMQGVAEADRALYERIVECLQALPAPAASDDGLSFSSFSHEVEGEALSSPLPYPSPDHVRKAILHVWGVVTGSATW